MIDDISNAPAKLPDQIGKPRPVVPGNQGAGIASGSVAASFVSVANSQDSEQDIAEQVKDTVEQLNRVVQDRNLSVEFSVEESINRQVVKVIDKDTGDVFLQLPSEAVLNAIRNLDALRGVFLDDLA